jgi:hypothetical protein
LTGETFPAGWKIVRSPLEICDEAAAVPEAKGWMKLPGK